MTGAMISFVPAFRNFQRAEIRTPNPYKDGGPPIAVPMLWGDGQADSADAARLAAFKKLTTAPPYVLGFEEPDCPSGSGSAGMSVSEGATLWDQLIAPFAAKGTKLGSPSMCSMSSLATRELVMHIFL